MSVKGHIRNFVKKPSQIFEFTITWNGIVLLIRIFKKKKKKKYSVAQEANTRPVSAHVSCSVYSCFNTS